MRPNTIVLLLLCSFIAAGYCFIFTTMFHGIGESIGGFIQGAQAFVVAAARAIIPH